MDRTKFLIRQKVFEKNLRAASKSTFSTFYWLKRKKALNQKSFPTVQFVLENSKYFKSYHGKTKILKIYSFSKKFLISSPCYFTSRTFLHCFVILHSFVRGIVKTRHSSTVLNLNNFFLSQFLEFFKS